MIGRLQVGDVGEKILILFEQAEERLKVWGLEG
jgi:hypothetical protein